MRALKGVLTDSNMQSSVEDTRFLEIKYLVIWAQITDKTFAKTYGCFCHASIGGKPDIYQITYGRRRSSNRRDTPSSGKGLRF